MDTPSFQNTFLSTFIKCCKRFTQICNENTPCEEWGVFGCRNLVPDQTIHDVRRFFRRVNTRKLKQVFYKLFLLLHTLVKNTHDFSEHKINFAKKRYNYFEQEHCEVAALCTGCTSQQKQDVQNMSSKNTWAVSQKHCKLKVEMKQSVKFTLFRKITSILIKTNITNMINVTILKKKGCFVTAFGARAPPSCSITACDLMGFVRSDGQYSNKHFFTFWTHTCFEFEDVDLESTVESIISAIYAFDKAMGPSSIWGWRSREPAGLG